MASRRCGVMTTESAPMDSLLALPVIDGPVPWVLLGLSLIVLLVLVIRPWTARRLLGAAIGIAAGAAVAVAAVVIADATDAFGMPLPAFVLWSAMGMLAAVGLAIASFWGTRWWRKLIAALGIIVFVTTGAIWINAQFGINPTLGSIFGIVPDENLDLPDGASTGVPAPDKPLYETWNAPAGMPATGKVGTQVIPATTSGFDARPAGIYLPPAAQVADPPALPVIVFMMGQPGNPDPSYIAAALDEYAAQHDGLAPIAVVADQIGADQVDTACADSRAYGNAKSYILDDVVPWIRANLHVIDDPRYWAIGGYSNGGGCAIALAAEHPELWKNVMDISGEPFPGAEQVDNVIANIYGGDRAAFEASKPVNVLAAHPGAYTGMTAAFTAGGNDPEYVSAAKTVSDAARSAGMTVSNDVIPGAGHVVDALTAGLTITIGKMYPALGLAAP